MLKWVFVVLFTALVIYSIIGLCEARPFDWRAEAEYYASNYPDSTSNEKAQMLVDSMKLAGETATVVEKVYEVKVLYVYDSNGRQLFPVFDVEKNIDHFKSMNDRIKEIRQILKSKESECSSLPPHSN